MVWFAKHAIYLCSFHNAFHVICMQSFPCPFHTQHTISISLKIFHVKSYTNISYSSKGTSFISLSSVVPFHTKLLLVDSKLPHVYLKSVFVLTISLQRKSILCPIVYLNTASILCHLHKSNQWSSLHKEFLCAQYT